MQNVNYSAIMDIWNDDVMHASSAVQAVASFCIVVRSVSWHPSLSCPVAGTCLRTLPYSGKYQSWKFVNAPCSLADKGLNMSK